MDLNSRFSGLSKVQLKDAIATPKGKGVAAGLILVVVLLVVLVIVTFAVPKPRDLAVKPVAKSPQPAAVPVTPASESTETAVSTNTVETENVSIDGAYDFRDYRDPFSPLVETTGTTGASTISAISSSPVSTSTPAGIAVVPQVLSLQGISNDGGVRVASVLYQGQQYQVQAGGQVGTSPFQITDVGDTSISLLYGDDRLTLQLGDEIVK